MTFYFLKIISFPTSILINKNKKEKLLCLRVQVYLASIYNKLSIGNLIFTLIEKQIDYIIIIQVHLTSLCCPLFLFFFFKIHCTYV